jgi:hypothetical protein
MSNLRRRNGKTETAKSISNIFSGLGFNVLVVVDNFDQKRSFNQTKNSTIRVFSISEIENGIRGLAFDYCVVDTMQLLTGNQINILNSVVSGPVINFGEPRLKEDAVANEELKKLQRVMSSVPKKDIRLDNHAYR